jgi:hypothetical protein
MNRAAISLLSITLLGAGCASTGLNQPDSWHVVKSKRFTMYTPTTLTHSETLNGLEYHYASLASSFFTKDIGGVDVVFLENDEFTDVFGTRRDFVALHRVPGQGKIGKEGLLVVRPAPTHAETDQASTTAAARKSGDRDDSSAEALTHIFVDRVLPKAPLWFHEGFSAYARMAEYKEGEGKRFACFGAPGTTESRFMPLDKVFTMSWDEYDGDEARSWYKNTARMLIDFAMHGDGGSHQRAMGAMVEGILAGQDTGLIMKTGFPSMDSKQLADRIAAHGVDVLNQPKTIRGICPIAFPIPPDKVADVGDKTLAAADAADIRAVTVALKSLPRRDDGYPAWYPEEIIAQAEKSLPK